MRIYGPLFLLLILVSSTSFAQKRFVTGLKLGVTASQVDGDTYQGYHKVGPIVGATLSAKFNEKWSAQFEVFYIQKGAKHNGKPDEGDYSFFLMRLNYIEMPFLYRRQLKTNFGFEAGLSFAILIDNKNREFDIYGKIPARPDFEKYEIAAHAGFKYFLNEKQSVNLRYSNSVIPIRKSPGISTYNYFIRGQYNIVLSLTYEHSF